MKHNRVLIVGPYPILRPQHGGQKRAKAIFDFYKREFDDAKYVGVFHRGQYPEWSEDDLPLGDPDVIAEVDKYPYASELICGEAIDKDIHVRSYMAELLRNYKPTIIHIEQPFAYLGLKKLLSELEFKAFIVFGSQNIEYLLKERVFRDLSVAPKLAGELVEKVKRLEYTFSKEADLVIAVNHEDAVNHKEMGAKVCIIAGNGIEYSKPTSDYISYWQSMKEKGNINSILVFVGSGHPPNWEGFLDLIGGDMSFLPPASKIIIAGGVSDYFNETFSKSDSSFWNKVMTVGRLEEDSLVSLLSVADIILLPITTERGSNLKTAEAILTRKKIVATDNTFHGFENFVRLPNIYIGNNREKFKGAILEALARPYIELSAKEIKLSNKVQWEYCLLPMKRAIKRGLFIKNILSTCDKVRLRLRMGN